MVGESGLEVGEGAERFNGVQENIHLDNPLGLGLTGLE